MKLKSYIIIITLIAVAGVGYFGYDQYQNYQDNQTVDDLGSDTSADIPADSAEEPVPAE